MIAHPTRREFSKALGGLIIGFTLSPSAIVAQQAPALPLSLNANRRLDSWIRIGADGLVTISTGKVEYGQGILTPLMQMAAEELDVKFERMRILTVDTSRSPNEGYTFGSLSIEHSGSALRRAAAEARNILLNAAARHLKLPVEQLSVEDGEIKAQQGSIAYWELVKDGELLRAEISVKAPLKPQSQYKLVGKSVARPDIVEKVTGGLAYVHDLRLPDMAFGRVIRPPNYNSELVEVDETRVNKLPGIVAVVRDGNFLGVVAQREEHAIKAREILIEDARWRTRPARPLPQDLLSSLISGPTEDTVIADKGSANPAPTGNVVEASYFRPLQAHAAIGPSCAVAQWLDGTLKVWSHTQAPYPLRKDLANAFSLDEAKVVVTHMEGAGCYGHNGADDATLDAALLARAIGSRPIKLQWMRDDEFAWEPFGSAMAMRARAVIDDRGRIADWSYEVWSNTHAMRPGQSGGNNLLASWHIRDRRQPTKPMGIPQRFGGGGDRNAIPIYEVPRQKITDHLVVDMPLRVSALRTLGGFANVFAIESFMDELAAAANTDPAQFRLNHLRDSRAREVIEAVLSVATWKPKAKNKSNVGRGLGFARYKNTACYVAVVVDVEVNADSGSVRVLKAFAAVDSGQIINPDGLRNQIEGGIIQGISWTLKEQVSYGAHGITSRDWSSYPILTFPEIPKIQVVLIDRPSESPLGAGEASLGPAAAAVANAIYDAAGRRIRTLPINEERLKKRA
jgi:CO/xanthine dehydrogenase Mo-binding subunit